ncbi:MAG: prepilin-type N-terminal cleavage/methylation domain-containing protein [Thermoanaerobacteraceae bacterium]|nr:prepilin-type N-terminal cleavage/methylation domain-containing protein [Thermoanaerobacteraceae bacterium]
MFKRYLNNEKGFSMIEMMVVLSIIAVLMAGGIKFYLGYIENSRVTKAKAQISTMQAALDAYYAEQSEYPADKAGLLNAGIAAKDNSTFEATDPWGEPYKYEVKKVNQSAYAYVVYTGNDKVQGQSNTYVVGRGTSGDSDAPVIETSGGAPEP